MGFENINNNEKVAVVEMLKEAGMNLDGYHNAITGQPMQAGQELIPNTWNENSGIIAFVDSAGKFFAVPSTDRYRSALMTDKIMQKSDIGVPHLGNPEIWHKNPKEGEAVSGFQKWQQLTFQASGLREIDNQNQSEAEIKETISREIRSASGGEVEPTPEELEHLYRVSKDNVLPPPQTSEQERADYDDLMNQIRGQS